MSNLTKSFSYKYICTYFEKKEFFLQSASLRHGENSNEVSFSLTDESN